MVVFSCVYKSTIQLAKELLGCFLVHETSKGLIKGRIVETEAYLRNDEASHSFRGKTERNKTMFNGPGFAYVYFTYGMHNCFNVTSKVGEAVLIRAVEPLEGIELMKKNRKTDIVRNLCSGPAKLTQAFGISLKHDGVFLDEKSKLKILKGNKPKNVVKTTRVGISSAKDKLYRFYEKGNVYISKN